MSKEALKLALEGAANYIDALGGDSRKYRQTLANEALDKKAENARELGLDYEPAQPRAWFTIDELNAWADKKLKENPQWAEQPAQQEPVAHRDGFWCADLTCKKCYSADFRFKHKNSVVNESLTTPAQRKPLTEEDAFDLVQQDYRMEEYTDAAMQLIRRTEAAHGIKEQP